MSSQGFIPLAKKLSKNNTTIIYDQRGTGLSKLDTINSSTVQIDLMVEDIEALRKHFGYEKWIVMGHSFGGLMAYYYASKYTQKVTAMIQSSSSGMDLAMFGQFNIRDGLTSLERDSLRYYSNKIRNGDNSYKTVLKNASFLAPAYVNDPKHIPTVAKRLTQGNRQINSLVWQDIRQKNFDVKDDLKTFDKPVLILHGEQDIVPLQQAQNAHDILKNSQLVLLPNTKHYGWLDCKKLYYHSIFNFIIKHSKDY